MTSPTPWRCHGGGLFNPHDKRRGNYAPTKAEDVEKGNRRRAIEILDEARELGDILLEVWEDE